jgi:hypothetical protein
VTDVVVLQPEEVAALARRPPSDDGQVPCRCGHLFTRHTPPGGYGCHENECDCEQYTAGTAVLSPHLVPGTLTVSDELRQCARRVANQPRPIQSAAEVRVWAWKLAMEVADAGD